MTYWDQRAETVGGRVATFDGIDWTAGTQAMVDLILPWLPDSGTVADLGCGIGRMTVPLAEERPDLDFVGVDASAAILAQTLDAPDNVSFVHADVASLPHAMEVDGAFSVLVVQHLSPEQVAAMFAEVRRALPRGGRFVCQWVYGDYHAPNDHRYPMHEMDDMWGALPVETFEGVHPDWQWGVWET